MKNFFKRNLAIRTAAIIVVAVTALGAVVISVAIVSNYQGEKSAQNRQLDELLSTVMNTTRIAVFLGDGELGGEIAEGLIGNEAVDGVTIQSGGSILVSIGNTTPDTGNNRFYMKPEVLTRPVVSPFPPKEQIGEITLVSNPRALAENIRQSSISSVVIQLAELFAIGLCIIIVVMRLITHPITSISNRLHNLNITLGEKIPLPSEQNRKDEIGQLVHDVNVMIDRVVNLLNTEKSLRSELEVNERKFRSIFENATSAIFLVDDHGRLISYNLAFLNLFHLSATKLAATPQLTIFELVGDQAVNLETLIKETISSDSNRDLEVCIEREKPVWLKMVLSPGEDGSIQIVANEITTFKTAVSEVEKKTATDVLTGLGNRRGVDKKLTDLLDPNQNHSENASTLFFIDLDHFKEVNDSYGHQAGDQVLVNVADIIRTLIRNTDYAARLGGDEFIVILQDVGEDYISTRFARDFLVEVEKPMPINADAEVQIGASIGIAYGMPGKVTPEQLLENADSAMYRAKEQGRHQFVLYQEDKNSIHGESASGS